MRWWICAMYLMARARVLSPEPDSPLFWFGCRCRMESLAMTLSSATLSWVWVVFRPLSSVTPEISYAGFFVSHYFDCEAWFASLPPEFLSPESVDYLRIRWGLRCLEAIVSSPLSQVSFSSESPWLVSIVRPSVWKRTSPSIHWCWAGFLRLLHRCVHLLCSRTACPRWEASWCRIPCREWWSRREWRNSESWPEYYLLFPRSSEPFGPLAANTW